jgi:hypothetical protein
MNDGLSIAMLTSRVVSDISSISFFTTSISMKTMNNVLLIVECPDEQNVFVHVPNTSGFKIDFENTFWKMFKKKLHNYDRLDAIFPQPLFHIVNINTTFGHVFTNIKNCPINITYVVNLKSIPALKLVDTIDSS